LTAAAALDKGLIKPDTICDICDQPYKIGKYTINTWNNEYHPNSTVTEVLANSDNIGMIFIANKMGIEVFTKYLQDFGIGQRTGIDLEGEVEASLRESWSEIDLLTASFGQGLIVSGVQMVQAVGAVANGGMMMKPQMVHKIIDSRGETIIEPKAVRQVISSKTSETLTEMLVAAVKASEAKWALPQGYRIAGKTGTAQIVTEKGYDEKKTIASYIGFAPAEDPKFVMLTIIREPTSSEWGSETAAPLFFNLAEKLFVMMNIPRSE
jgi:cell division protein FtsI/penicillin-binding protein 2